MKIMTIACLFFLLTGCSAIFPTSQTNQEQSDQFHSSLEQLLQNNNTTPMKVFIKEQPDNIYVNDAKRILQLHTDAKSCRGELKSCSKKLNSQLQELEKLREDIDRLTQLNLEMDRSSP